MMKTTTNEVVIEAIILKKTPYKENDMILHVYTKEYGKISIIGRGLQKITSKNARGCQEMMVSELTIHLRKGLSTLIKATPIDYLRHIKEDLESEIIGNYILEFFYRYVEENNPIIEDYDLLNDSLQALNNGYQPLLVYLLINAYILKRNGVAIHVDGCVVCGSQKVVGISLDDGGFLCENHIGNHSIHTIDLLKAFRHVNKVPMNEIDSLKINETCMNELIKMMTYLIEEYTGISLRTQTFIQQIV